MRRLVTVSAVFALALSVSTPAMAAVHEDGYRYCGTGKAAVATALAYGNLRLIGPGETNGGALYGLGGTWTSKSRSGPGGYWYAGIEGGYGGLDGAGTHSWCSGS